MGVRLFPRIAVADGVLLDSGIAYAANKNGTFLAMKPANGATLVNERSRASTVMVGSEHLRPKAVSSLPARASTLHGEYDEKH
jgi:hypothetical protein